MKARRAAKDKNVLIIQSVNVISNQLNMNVVLLFLALPTFLLKSVSTTDWCNKSALESKTTVSLLKPFTFAALYTETILWQTGSDAFYITYKNSKGDVLINWINKSTPQHQQTLKPHEPKRSKGEYSVLQYCPHCLIATVTDLWVAECNIAKYQ